MRQQAAFHTSTHSHVHVSLRRCLASHRGSKGRSTHPHVHTFTCPCVAARTHAVPAAQRVPSGGAHSHPKSALAAAPSVWATGRRATLRATWLVDGWSVDERETHRPTQPKRDPPTNPTKERSTDQPNQRETFTATLGWLVGFRVWFSLLIQVTMRRGHWNPEEGLVTSNVYFGCWMVVCVAGGLVNRRLLFVCWPVCGFVRMFGWARARGGGGYMRRKGRGGNGREWGGGCDGTGTCCGQRMRVVKG
eukprot:363526-Chlamydomonas_euryale.AAC.2